MELTSSFLLYRGLVHNHHPILKKLVDFSIFYPKRTDKDLYKNLVNQCQMMDISFLETLPEQSVLDTEYSVLVDALFGFSFHPPVRESFLPLLVSLSQSRTPLASIDIPSGIIISIFNWGNFLPPPLSSPYYFPNSFLHFSSEDDKKYILS